MNSTHIPIRSILSLMAVLILLPLSSCAQQIWKFSTPTLSINNQDFAIFLDSIVNHERPCAHFDSTYLWYIKIKNNADNSRAIVDVTMTDGIPSSYGHFYLKNTLFFVDGDTIDLYDFTENSNDFSYKVNTTKIPYARDFSLWRFIYIDGHIELEDAWVLKCIKE